MDINKTFTRPDILNYIETSPTVAEIRNLVDILTEKGFRTTAAGHLAKSNLSEQVKYQFTVHNMRAWEYGRVYDILQLRPGMKVLDCGGASSPLVFYCAQKGINITTIDLQSSLVQNSKEVAEKMGWKMNALVQDMTQMPFEKGSFDAVFSISVLEHMNHDLKGKSLREFNRVLKPGGMVGITFDFGRSIDAKTSYDYKKYDQYHTPIQNIFEIQKYVIEASGLEVYGNKVFKPVIDNDKIFIKKSWLKNSIHGNSFFKDLVKFIYLYSPFFDSPYFHYTFFSLFLRKPGPGL
jgi:ubiquinone/menaquinone biosynthesis C-methylase UbiE